jgi:hypothetical protein
MKCTGLRVHNVSRAVNGGFIMAKYGPKAQKEVEQTMHEHKHEGKFESPQQAIAVGLDKARRAGGKVPDEKRSKK